MKRARAACVCIAAAVVAAPAAADVTFKKKNDIKVVGTMMSGSSVQFIKGMKMRVLPSEIQKRTFELLGAIAMPMDLTEAIAMIKAGTLDAQENPLANTVTYGVHKFHKFHTLTYHFYISRPVFLHRPTFESWPGELQRAMQGAVTESVAFQRGLAEEENVAARKIIEAAGCEIAELSEKEHAAFVAAVQPLLADARGMYGEDMFKMARKL